LLKQLDNKDFPREKTYQVLAEFGDIRAITPLVARLETNDYRTLKKVFPRFGTAAEPELLRLFETTSNSTARDSALFLLGEVGTETSLRILEPLAEKSGAEGYRAKLAVEKIQARSG
jgi:HEAT repeat protein